MLESQIYAGVSIILESIAGIEEDGLPTIISGFTEVTYCPNWWVIMVPEFKKVQSKSVFKYEGGQEKLRCETPN